MEGKDDKVLEEKKRRKGEERSTVRNKN